jgi:hypothetical protein
MIDDTIEIERFHFLMEGVRSAGELKTELDKPSSFEMVDDFSGDFFRSNVETSAYEYFRGKIYDNPFA